MSPRGSLNKVLFAVATIACNMGHAAEFNYVNIIPQVEITIHKKNGIALAVDPVVWPDRDTIRESPTKYFYADNKDFLFRRITSKEYSGLLSEPNFVSHLGTYYGATSNADRHGFKIIGKPSECHNYLGGVDTIEFGELSVPLALDCKSSVADAVLVSDEIWILTFEQGGHGEYGAEGVVILDTEGSEKARVNSRGYATRAAVVDPWTSDVSVVTQGSVIVVGPDYKVKASIWPVHQFDVHEKRPDVALVNSSTEVLTDQFAIFAYSLGSESFRKFFDIIKDLQYDRSSKVLETYYGYGTNYRPTFPLELNALIPAAKPTYSWRKFLCALRDSRAEKLCKLELDEWPSEY